MGLNPLQVDGRGLVLLLPLDELGACRRGEPATEPPAQWAIAELLHVGRGDELGRRHAVAAPRGALFLWPRLSICAAKPPRRSRRRRTRPGGRPGLRAATRRTPTSADRPNPRRTRPRRSPPCRGRPR